MNSCLGPPTKDRLKLILLCLFLFSAAAFLRLFALDDNLALDEIYTLLRLSGHTESEFYRSAGEAMTAGAMLDKFQRLDQASSCAKTAASIAADEPQLAPLYFCGALGWARIFGDSPASVRAFSSVLGLAAVIALGLMAATAYHSNAVGVAAAAIAAFAPSQVLYGRLARPYALLLLLSSLACFFVFRAAGGSRAWRWCPVVFCFALGLYTHLLFVLVICVLCVWLILQQPRPRRSTSAGFACSFLAALLLLMPWLAVLVRGRTAALSRLEWSQRPWPAASLAHIWLTHAAEIFSVTPLSVRPFNAVYPPPLWEAGAALTVKLSFVVVIGAALLAAWRQKKYPGPLLALILTVLPFLLLGFFDLVLGGGRSATDRYLLPSWLGTIVLCAAAICNGDNQRPFRRSVWLLMAIGTCSCLFMSTAKVWPNISSEKNRRLAEIVKRLSADGDYMIVTDAGLANTLLLAHQLPNSALLYLPPPAGQPLNVVSGKTLFLFSPTSALVTRASAHCKLRHVYTEVNVSLWSCDPTAEATGLSRPTLNQMSIAAGT